MYRRRALLVDRRHKKLQGNGKYVKLSYLPKDPYRYGPTRRFFSSVQKTKR